MNVLTPPNRRSSQIMNRDLFLAGSIEMGKAEDWQSKVIKALEDVEGLLIYNPRRTDWDLSWEQSIDNPQFNEQVTWELDHLTKANVCVFYFDPTTKSPITLMELGLEAHFQDEGAYAIVCCPNGFWRKGNVDILCRRQGIPQADNLDELIEMLKQEFSK